MPLILPGNVGSATAATGFDVANSCRFDDGSSAYMHKTPGGAGNRQKFTFSCWVKKTSGGTEELLSVGGSTYTRIGFEGGDEIKIFHVASGSTAWEIQTVAKYRDPSAWYNFVFAFDTTQGTASNRIKLYVNGVRVEPSSGFGDETYPSQNYTTEVNNAVKHRVGIANNDSSAPFDGYMSEVVLIDGQQLAPTEFGEFNEDSGIWKPIDVSGLTFGTNGFYLDFEDSSALGNDVAGSNNFTVNNLTAIDQSTDTCTNNFATLNPLTKSSATFSEGNLKQGGAGASAVATFGVSSGKWYFEQKILGGNNEAHLGFALEGSGIFSDNVTGSTVRGAGYVSLYSYDGKIYNEGSATASFGTFAANNIIGFALDVDNGNVYLYQNGSVLNSGNAVVSGKTGKTWFPFANFDAGDVTGIEHNFGGTQSFAISSGNTDGDGYGNFEYAVPSGYYALNTKNLAEYG